MKKTIITAIAAIMMTSGAHAACSTKADVAAFNNINTYNKSMLSDRDKCWHDVYSEKNHGIDGSVLWVRLNGTYYSALLSSFNGNKDAIKSWLDSNVSTEIANINSITDAVNTYNDAQTEITKIQTQIVEVEKIIEIEKIVEVLKEIEVPVEVIVEKIVEKFVDVEVEVIKEIIVDGGMYTDEQYLALKAQLDDAKAKADHVVSQISEEEISDELANQLESGVITDAAFDIIKSEHPTKKIVSINYEGEEFVAVQVSNGVWNEAYFEEKDMKAMPTDLVNSVSTDMMNNYNQLNQLTINDKVINLGSIANAPIFNKTQIADLNAAITQVAEEAYSAGYDSGYEDGYNDGYADGFADGVASVQ